MRRVLLLGCAILTCLASLASADVAHELLSQLDAPLLFVKRHSYTGIHIYDTYYKWPPGGGGIYVLENPAEPRQRWRIRPVIDPTTPETLGEGVYTHPELSWDATRLLFCFKGEPGGSTSIYEIGVDGKGLRRLTDPECACDRYQGSHGGQHDIAPAYLPDGRIVFLSTRPSGLVPCANEGVSILHVMNADGSDIHPISVNNVNEFDPSVLPDGRILFGRWEYVDKNALTIQSLWTVNPDGTQETALYANNMVFPEAVLDARPVPGTQLVVGTFAKHNAPPRGSIALVDPRRGKNSPQAAVNLEHPGQPLHDLGDSCEPWPVTPDTFLFSGRPQGSQRNAIEMIDRGGRRCVVLDDPAICLHAPMLVKPRPRPAVVPDTVDRRQRTGRFFVQDIYRGLEGVERGEVKWLRVIEETSRVSPTTMGGNPYNQTFLVSAALAFSAKNYLGVVPVDETGSAWFEVPAGRAVYLQALDSDGRLVQSMRTFVQAAPGATRSCIGCHEHKSSTVALEGLPSTFGREPDHLQPESWGSGYLDYPSMVQPVLDKHCVRCHGGEEGIGGGMDLSGGWTEHFNISYENLASRRETQLIAYWIAGIDCMNGTAPWSSQIFRPRAHGSGAAPLAELLAGGHEGRLPELTRAERDLLMAWIDSNGLYHGTWDFNEHGCAIRHWNSLRAELTAQMHSAGCLRCHGDGQRIAYFENDWINLENPRFSRILRAPLPKGAEGYGLGLCRDRNVDPARQRLHLLWRGYAHAVQPPEAFPKQPIAAGDAGSEPVASFASTDDPAYQAMLSTLVENRELTLAMPRIDMPGAERTAGECRTFLAPAVPETAPPIAATVDGAGVVHLAWERSARTIGLECELHRGPHEGFSPEASTLLARGGVYRYVDRDVTEGTHHYALVLRGGAHWGCEAADGSCPLPGDSGRTASRPSYCAVAVPKAPAPAAPSALQAEAASLAIHLKWLPPPQDVFGYHVYRRSPGTGELVRVTAEPVRMRRFVDGAVEDRATYAYAVTAVGLRGAEGPRSATAEAQAKVVREPMFAARFEAPPQGLPYGLPPIAGALHGGATCSSGVLELRPGGHATFPHHEAFDLGQPFTVECWVKFDESGTMPVVVSAGVWRQAGWFLQKIGGRWRWHVGGVDCDGGQPPLGQWLHVAACCDGQSARLYENGRLVAEQTGPLVTTPWPGALHVGQYSGSPGPEYQVTGRIAGLKIYHRLLTPAELAAAEPPADMVK